MADTSNDFSALAQKGFDSFVAHQNAFFQELNTFRRHWADAAEAQLNATAELMNKITSTCTCPISSLPAQRIHTGGIQTGDIELADG